MSQISSTGLGEKREKLSLYRIFFLMLHLQIVRNIYKANKRVHVCVYVFVGVCVCVGVCMCACV